MVKTQEKLQYLSILNFIKYFIYHHHHHHRVGLQRVAITVILEHYKLRYKLNLLRAYNYR